GGATSRHTAGRIGVSTSRNCASLIDAAIAVVSTSNSIPSMSCSPEPFCANVLVPEPEPPLRAEHIALAHSPVWRRRGDTTIPHGDVVGYAALLQSAPTMASCAIHDHSLRERYHRDGHKAGNARLLLERYYPLLAQVFP